MPQKGILSSRLIFFSVKRVNRILVKQCSALIADCNAQCNQKLRIVAIERN